MYGAYARRFLKRSYINTKEKMVLCIFSAGVFGNKSKWHKTTVQETRSPHNQKNVRYKIVGK